MEQYLPEITPLLIGLLAFAIGLVFALRERAWRKALRDSNSSQHNAAA